MAHVKASAMRDMSKDEITQRVSELREELFNLRFKHVTSQLEKTHRISETRGNIARLKTIMQERFGVKV